MSSASNGPFHSLHPFDPKSIPAELSGAAYVEVPPESKKLYKLLLRHIVCNSVGNEIKSSQSYNATVIGGTQTTNRRGRCSGGSCDPAGDEAKTVGRISLSAGQGLFSFASTEGSIMQALHQRIGEPVGTDCGAQYFTSIVIFCNEANGEEKIASFFSSLIEESEKTELGTYSYFKWNIRYEYWNNAGSCRARDIRSVILPKATMENLSADVSSFLAPESRSFYEKHGIPYRRSYLFYGLPGTGKTSLIQALAGEFKRSISYLNPTHPDMTDDSLKEAMTELPNDTILVLEDIDSLFASDRSNKSSKSSLTFSGLLNALDGVGSSNGQLVVMTTNLREQLDPALIRHGRVDLHIEFGYASDEQLRLMWESYYPPEDTSKDDRGDRFVAALRASLEGREVTASTIQSFFVQNMRESADSALAKIGLVLEDLKQKDVEKKQVESSGKKVEKDDDEDVGGKPGPLININPILLGSFIFLGLYTFLKR